MKPRMPSKYVIQADKLGNIIDVLEAIAEGPMTDGEIAKSLEITRRQGTYYRMAAESIGLIRYKEEKAELSDLGRILVNRLMDRIEQKSFLRVVVMTNPLLREIVDELEKAGRSGLRVDEIEHLVSEYSDLGGKTVSRRTGSIVKWLVFLKLASTDGKTVVHDQPYLNTDSDD